MTGLGPTFGVLNRRLLDRVRAALRNGQLTERGLARRIGISQPHLHNVLKGIRGLTPVLADSLLEGLGASAMELTEPLELGDHMYRALSSNPEMLQVPVLRGVLGPRWGFPETTEAVEWLRVPLAGLEEVRRPALALLGEDAGLPTVTSCWQMAMLELDENERLRARAPGWYAIRWQGRGFMRQAAVEEGALRVESGRGLPEWIDLGGINLLSVVRARVVWVGPDVRKYPFFRQIGVFLDMPAST